MRLSGVLLLCGIIVATGSTLLGIKSYPSVVEVIYMIAGLVGMILGIFALFFARVAFGEHKAKTRYVQSMCSEYPLQHGVLSTRQAHLAISRLETLVDAMDMYSSKTLPHVPDRIDHKFLIELIAKLEDTLLKTDPEQLTEEETEIINGLLILPHYGSMWWKVSGRELMLPKLTQKSSFLSDIDVDLSIDAISQLPLKKDGDMMVTHVILPESQYMFSVAIDGQKGLFVSIRDAQGKIVAYVSRTINVNKHMLEKQVDRLELFLRLELVS